MASLRRLSFSPEEDMRLWKFAMNHIGKVKKEMWYEFIRQTRSQRSINVVHSRFREHLLPYLSLIDFHTETKLKLCIQYRIPVDEAFLEKLQKHAIVTLDGRNVVETYTMKPNAPPNLDKELDDVEFLKLTAPVVQGTMRFTKEEDAQIWNYVIENHQNYGRGGERFWKNMVRKAAWNRTAQSITPRFNRSLAPNLHKTDLDTEIKLMLYKSCRIPVDQEFLETFKQQCELEIDKDGCVIDYKMHEVPPKKRKMEFDDVLDGIDVKKSKSTREMSNRSISLEVIVENALNGTSSSHASQNSSQMKKEDYDGYYSEEPYGNFSGILNPDSSEMMGMMKSVSENMARFDKKITKIAENVDVVRFTHTLAPKLHEMAFDMETKLKMYKAYEIPVDLKFLETLKRRYDLKIDPRGCVYWYQRKCDRKRKALWESHHHDHTYHQLADDTDEDDVDDDVVEIQNQNQSSVTPEPPENSFDEVKMEPIDDEDVPVEFTNFLNFQQLNLYQNSSEMTQILQGIIGTAAEQMRNEMTKMMEIVAENMTHFDRKITKLSKNLEESMKNEISEVAETVGTLKDDMEIIKHQMLLESSNLFSEK